jgi:hypothetical protein
MSRAIEERFDGGPLLMPTDDGKLISVHQACWMHRVWAELLSPGEFDYQLDSGCDCPCHEGRSAQQEKERHRRRLQVGLIPR